MPPDSLITSAAPATSLLERTLGPDWRCLADAVIRAGGESGPVDLVALHPRLGVVLVAAALLAWLWPRDELGETAEAPHG